MQSRACWEALRLGTRYQSAINRQLFEAMKELERTQAKRKSEQKDGGEQEEETELDETGTCPWGDRKFVLERFGQY